MPLRSQGPTLGLGTVLLCMACSGSSRDQASPAITPQATVDELLAADRAFSTASAATDLISGLSAMFADDVVTIPGKAFAEGEPKAIEALRRNPDNARSRLQWVPIRGGVSADGQHGFTFGYMTMHRPDSTQVPFKYLAYWVKSSEGWRVVAYKRRGRPRVEVSLDPMPPALPARMVPVSTDTAATARFRASLDLTERAFSDEAQRIGLAAAFARYGSADAVNMGGTNDTAFLVAAAIGRSISEGDSTSGSPVSWAPDRVIVASSGDLGVTIGMIRPNEPTADGAPPSGLPFFAIWRRASPGDPWRYVAE